MIVRIWSNDPSRMPLEFSVGSFAVICFTAMSVPGFSS